MAQRWNKRIGSRGATDWNSKDPLSCRSSATLLRGYAYRSGTPIWNRLFFMKIVSTSSCRLRETACTNSIRTFAEVTWQTRWTKIEAGKINIIIRWMLTRRTQFHSLVWKFIIRPNREVEWVMLKCFRIIKSIWVMMGMEVQRWRPMQATQ